MFTRGLRRFGEFELNPANHVLTGNSELIKLAPQPFKILMLLTERPGTLVTRASLREAVWGDETVVDFEHGLNTCIRQIRHALGDDAGTPRFIETVPRLGYRFTAAVTSISPELGSRPQRWRTVAAVAAILVAVVGVLIARLPRGTPQSKAVASEARELYLRGQLALADPNSGSARTALELFEKALALDPTHAAAHAGVAQVYLVRPAFFLGVPPDVAVLRAQLAIERALALDQSLPEAYLAAAELHMTQHDWPAAGREYRRAIDVAPSHTIVRQRYAMWLSYQGRFEEAIKEARLAESLDPLSVQARNTVAEVLRHARRCDEAILQAQRALTSIRTSDALTASLATVTSLRAGWMRRLTNTEGVPVLQAVTWEQRMRSPAGRSKRAVSSHRFRNVMRRRRAVLESSRSCISAWASSIGHSNGCPAPWTTAGSGRSKWPWCSTRFVRIRALKS